MINENVKPQEVRRLPMLALRGLVAFPNTILPFDAGRKRSIAAVNKAMEGDRMMLVVAQRDAVVEKPEMQDLYTVGTVVKIRQVLRLPDGAIRVMAEGVNRALLLQVDDLGERQEAIFINAPESLPEPSVEVITARSRSESSSGC